MGRKSLRSKSNTSETKEKLEKEYAETRKKISDLRESDRSRLEKTKAINILRKRLEELERDLEDF